MTTSQFRKTFTHRGETLVVIATVGYGGGIDLKEEGYYSSVRQVDNESLEDFFFRAEEWVGAWRNKVDSRLDRAIAAEAWLKSSGFERVES